MQLQIIITIIQVIVFVFFYFLFKSLLPSYFSQKGKNLATKEDIEEITGKIESIKANYSLELERAKDEISYYSQTRNIPLKVLHSKQIEFFDELSPLIVEFSSFMFESYESEVMTKELRAYP